MTTEIIRPAFTIGGELMAKAGELGGGVDPFDIQRKDTGLTGKRKGHELRFAVIWVLRELTKDLPRLGNPYSLKRVARLVGMEDHTSVIHAQRGAVKLRDRDPEFRKLTDALLDYAYDIAPRFRKAA